MSLVFFTVLALILLCPVAVNADEDKKPEFGTVIGIGELLSHVHAELCVR